VTIPESGETPLAARWLNMWTDAIGAAGTQTPDVNAGNYLIVREGWKGAPPPNVKKMITC